MIKSSKQPPHAVSKHKGTRQLKKTHKDSHFGATHVPLSSRHGERGSGGFMLKRRWAWGAILLVLLGLYIWAFYNFFVSPFSPRWHALYGDPNYPDGYAIHGIDISHHQGTIDWPRLRNAIIDHAPLRFILIKATEGASYVDPNFADNFYQAREYGFIRGAYHFWANTSTPRAQAAHFLRNVPLEKGDLPPVLDVESKPQNQSTQEFQRDILTFLHIVEDHYHVKPIIYTYYKFKQTQLNDARFNDYPYWIAHYYVDTLRYQGPWKFWQHTDAGRLPGIKGYVDFDIYNGSYYDLRMLTIGNNALFDEKPHQD